MAAVTEAEAARYAVLGHPIAHSLSPRIHALFARQTGQAMEYRAIDVAPEGLTEFWRRGAGRELAGANVTVPLKALVCELVDERSARAALAGAVNTVVRLDDGRLAGDNTDGVGLVRDLQRLGWPVGGRRLLIVGAGGAARGILGPLLERSPDSVTIANRNRSRAVALATRFGHGILARSLSELTRAGRFDGVIDASAAGPDDPLRLPDSLVDAGSWCYALNYGTAAAAFVEWARAAGAGAAADGLGMLVEQAAESFYLWRGVRPDPEPVRHRLTG